MAKNQRFTLYTDGGARGNPGPAAIGFIILDASGSVAREHAGRIGIATNNQAEYKALIAGLELAATIWTGEIDCVSDSELLVRQLTGVYAVRSANMKPLHSAVKALERSFHGVTYKHVARDDPWIARCDAMVNRALDG